MTINRFSLSTKIPLSEIGIGGEQGNLFFSGFAGFGQTEPGDLCFCDKEPNENFINIPVGSIVLCSEFLYKSLKKRFTDIQFISMPDPRATFIDIGHKLLERNVVQVTKKISDALGVHPTAKVGLQTVVHPEVRIDENVIIGAHCVINRGTWIKSGTIIKDGTIIGIDGINAYRGNDGKLRSFPHFAGVIVGNNVEIGSGVVVVRGLLNSTIIGNNTIIGNLCNIGHVVNIGEKVWMSVGCLIGGHTKINSGATLGMGVTVRDNIEIGENAQVGMSSVVVRKVKANCSVFGNPARIISAIQAGPVR